MEANHNILSVDDGIEKLTICNRFGDTLGEFSFRPSDTSIVTRYNTSLEMLEKAVEPLRFQNLEETDSDAALKAFADALKAARTGVCECFDYLFGGNAGEAFFGKVDPFTLTNGRFYCENVIEAVGGFIGERMGVETAKLNQRVEKYTHGYRTGKHKNGKR